VGAFCICPALPILVFTLKVFTSACPREAVPGSTPTHSVRTAVVPGGTERGTVEIDGERSGSVRRDAGACGAHRGGRVPTANRECRHQQAQQRRKVLVSDSGSPRRRWMNSARPEPPAATRLDQVGCRAAVASIRRSGCNRMTPRRHRGLSVDAGRQDKYGQGKEYVAYAYPALLSVTTTATSTVCPSAP
jgi:hypothetical protein